MLQLRERSARGLRMERGRALVFAPNPTGLDVDLEQALQGVCALRGHVSARKRRGARRGR